MGNRSSRELSNLLSSVKKKIDGNRKLEALNNSGFVGTRTPAMYRVPNMLRGQNDHAYSPTTVSIGPLHRGTPRLHAMEEVKLSYMCCLFERTEKPEETQKACMTAMLRNETQVRICYEMGKPGVMSSRERLAEIMVIDGCFIIDLLYRNYENHYYTQNYYINDPILQYPSKYYAVQRDLLLLENQIPFFVLQELFSMTVGRIQTNSNRRSLNRCLVSFFGDIIGGEHEIDREVERKHFNTNPYHILDFLRIHYVPTTTTHESASKDGKLPKFKYSATELRSAGVKLKGARNRNHFDIKFSGVRSCGFCFWLMKSGRFEVPTFSIYESTEPFLRNLIAFEQCCPWMDSYFTWHAFLMDTLIDTPEDVQLFEEAGVICNYLGSRDAVSQLFNGICKYAVPRHFLYAKEYNQAMGFCNSRRRFIQKLRYDYFGNPWSGISVIAAFFLFALTVLSAVYTIISYYFSRSTAGKN